MPDAQIHSLFPTPIWVVDYEPEVYESLNRDLLGKLKRMMDPRPPVGIGGTLQTDNDLHTLPHFAELSALIADAVESALKGLGIVYENFEFTGMWANINPTGAINTPHAHPNNYLSGVYYAQTQEGADSIYFMDPRPQASLISPPIPAENIYTGNEARVEARNGRLVMFPAWLVHGVPVNRSDRDRVSFSFNVMFSGFTETMSAPKWQPTVRLNRDIPPD